MKHPNSPKKILFIVAAAVVTFVILLAIISHLIYSLSSSTSPALSGQSINADDVPVAPEVANKEDLDKAINTLEAMNLDAVEDTQQLEHRLEAF